MENGKTQLSELVESSIGKIRELVDSGTVVGEPITTPDGITLIPVSRVSFGFGTGGGSGLGKNAGGNAMAGGTGAGVRVEPMGFVVVKDGNVRMMNFTPPAGSTAERIVEMVPDVLDRIETFLERRKSSD